MAHDKIAHGRSLVEAGNREILDGYLDRIETVYTHLEPLQKEMLFSDLEKLVGQFEASPIKHSTYQPRANSNFDGQEAKKVRLEAGLSIPHLIEDLQIVSRGALQSISDYEKGKKNPSNPPKGDLPTKYISWLAELGYDPYGLKN